MRCSDSESASGPDIAVAPDGRSRVNHAPIAPPGPNTASEGCWDSTVDCVEDGCDVADGVDTTRDGSSIAVSRGPGGPVTGAAEPGWRGSGATWTQAARTPAASSRTAVPAATA